MLFYDKDVWSLRHMQLDRLLLRSVAVFWRLISELLNQLNQ